MSVPTVGPHEPAVWARRSFATAALLIVFGLGTVTRADPDLWGHTRFGLDLLNTGHLPEIDGYSFTQDRPWINHEWLSEWVMGLVFATSGAAGLSLLKGATLLATAGVWFVALRRTDYAVVTLLCGFVALGTARLTLTLRPQIWSFLLIALLCWILTRAWRRPVWPATLVAGLFVLWANLHGGWIVGLGVLAAWTAGSCWDDRRVGAGWAVITATAVLGTLLTPYGWGLWQFMADTIRLTRNVTEWQPLWTTPVLNWVFTPAAVGMAAWLLRQPVPHRVSTAAVLAMLAGGALLVERLAPLFVLSASILLAPAFAERWPRRVPSVVRPRQARAALAVLAAAVVFSAGVGARSMRCIPVSGDRMPDERAARALDTHGGGRLVTFFDWGQYALWHWGPTLRVSMDGRRETLYSEKRLAEHDAVLFGDPEGLTVLRRWQAEYVWLPAWATTTRDWLESNGYRLDVATSRSYVAVRTDLPALEPPPSPPTAVRCFPR